MIPKLFALILALLTGCLIGTLCLRVARLEQRLQMAEFQWSTTDGEVKALGNKGYEGEH